MPAAYHRGVPQAPALPAETRNLLGRADEVAALTAALIDAGERLVTITGPPGVGKTRLALAVAHAVADRFADGAVWVDLAPVRDPGLVLAEIARSLNVPLGARPEPRTASSAMASREVLVVLDNAEHLVPAAERIGELVAGARGLRVLVTSRERLRLAAEWEFPLPPLPMPGEADLADLDRLRANPAVALLVSRAPGGVSLSLRTAPALAAICLRLDGLPLAIELAAARLRVFTPAELAFRLERRMAALAPADRDAPARHRDLRAAIDWSHELLPEAERAAFRRLSVFAGAWTLSAAREVCTEGGTDGGGNEIVDVVASLLDKNLVRRVDADADAGVDSDREARFTMLASLREFAAEQLEQCGEQDVTRDRHAAHFAETAARWERTVGTNEEAVSWLSLAGARADLIVALEHCRRRGTTGAALWLAAALCWYGYTRGDLVEAGPASELLAPPAETDADPEPRQAALLGAGVVAFGVGESDPAERHLLAVLAAGGPPGADRRAAVAVAFLGHVAKGRGEFGRAAERYAEAAVAFERLGNRRATAWVAHDLGLLALEQGDLPAAERQLREALLAFRELDYDWAIAVCAWGLATTRLRAGDRSEPPPLLAEALTRHVRLADERGVARCLETAAELSLARGEAARAARLLGAASARRDAVGARPSPVEQEALAGLRAAVRRTLGPGGADHELHAGRTMPAAAAVTLAAEVTRTTASEPGPPSAELTPRQLDVAALVAAGRTNRQIGRALDITEKTAEAHVRNIMERLGAPSRAGVAAWAATRGLRPAEQPPAGN